MHIDQVLKDITPLLIDGGLSNVLEAKGYDLNHKLWTANLLENNPNAIIQAHLEYLKAGAQCLTTSSYQASIPGLMAIGHTKAKAKELILQSVQLAKIAIKTAFDSGMIDYKPLIAAGGNELLLYSGIVDKYEFPVL